MILQVFHGFKKCGLFYCRKIGDFTSIWRNYTEIDHVMQKVVMLSKRVTDPPNDLIRIGNPMKVLRHILLWILDGLSACVPNTSWYIVVCPVQPLWFIQRKWFLWVKIWSFWRLLVAHALSAYFLFYWLFGQDFLRASNVKGLFNYFVASG